MSDMQTMTPGALETTATFQKSDMQILLERIEILEKRDDALNHLIKHLQEGIKKSFEKIDKLQQLIERERFDISNRSNTIEILDHQQDEIHDRIDELERYKSLIDFHNETIKKLNVRINILEDSIKIQNSARLAQEVSAAEVFERFNYPKIRERLEKLEYYMTMEDRITASDVLLRLEILESEKKFYSDRKETKKHYINVYSQEIGGFFVLGHRTWCSHEDAHANISEERGIFVRTIEVEI